LIILDLVTPGTPTQYMVTGKYTEIFWVEKASHGYRYKFRWNGFGSGSAIMMPIQPAPDPQHSA